MDFSYENNKGLHAFFLALVMILGIFTVFAPIKSYAEFAPSRPTAPFKVINVKFKTFGSVSNSVGFGFPNNFIEMNSTANAKKMTSVRVYNVTKKKDYSDLFVIDYDNAWQARINLKSGLDNTTRFSSGDEVEVSYIFSELMEPSTFGFIDYENNKINYMISSSFQKTVPAVPAQPVTVQAKAVQELPTVLGKVAGIVTLVGCLILGILLAVGLVKRLISLFLR